MKKLGILFLHLLIGTAMLWAQQDSFYVFLPDASGIDRTERLPRLETAAKAIAETFPTTDLQNKFKVFDAGMYLLNEKMEGGTAASFEKLKMEAAAASPYYLLFAKSSNPFALYDEFWVDMKLPGIEAYPCLGDTIKSELTKLIQLETRKVYADEDKLPFKFYAAEIAAMEKLQGYLYQYIHCCGNTDPNRMDCSPCPIAAEDEVAILEGRGMLEFTGENISFTIGRKAYEHPNLQADFSIEITNTYSEDRDAYQWSFTDELEQLLNQVEGAKARVLYFNETNCDKFDDYLNGNYPAPQSASRTTPDTTFFEEIIVLDRADKQRVFFKFNGNDQSEASILWTMQHLAISKRGGLTFLGACLDIEQCLADKPDYATTWAESEIFTSNFEFLQNAWDKAADDSSLFGSNYPFAMAWADYLLTSSVARFNKSMDQMATIAQQELIKAVADMSEMEVNIENALHSGRVYEGCYLGVDHWKVDTLFKNLNLPNNGEASGYTFTFATPSGHYISLPNDVKYVTFFYGFDGNNIGEEYEKFLQITPGTLKSFRILKGNTYITYNAKIEEKNGKFVLQGYVDSADKHFEYIRGRNNHEDDNVYFGLVLQDKYIIADFRMNLEVLDIDRIESQSIYYELKNVLDFPQINATDESHTWDFNRSDVIKHMFGYPRTSLNQTIINTVYNHDPGDIDIAIVKNKVMEIAHAYKDLFLETSSQKLYYNNWHCPANHITTLLDGYISKFDKEFTDEFCECDYPDLINPNPYDQSINCEDKGTLPNKQEAYKLYYKYLIGYIRQYGNENYSNLLELDVPTIKQKSIQHLVNTVNKALDGEIATQLNAEEILWIISRIVNTPGTLRDNLNQEAVIKLLRFANPATYADILLGLEGKNKETPTKLLVCQVFNRVDGGLFGLNGDDNSKEFMKTVSNMVSNSGSFYNERVANYSDHYKERFFIFDFQNFVVRSLVATAEVNVINIATTWLEIGNIAEYYSYQSIDSECDEAADSLIITQAQEGGYFFLKEEDPTKLRPFDLIQLVNKSNLNPLKQVQLSGLVPAIFGTYAAQVGDKETTEQAISTVIDAASLAVSGAGLLKAGSQLKKAFYIIDMLSSSASMGATIAADYAELENIKNALNLISITTGVITMSEDLFKKLSPEGFASRQPVTRRVIGELMEEIGDNTALPNADNFFDLTSNIIGTPSNHIRTIKNQNPEAINQAITYLTRIHADARLAGNADLADETIRAVRHIANSVNATGLTGFAEQLKTIFGTFISETQALSIAKLDGVEKLVENSEIAAAIFKLGKSKSLEFFRDLANGASDANHIAKNIGQIEPGWITARGLLDNTTDATFNAWRTDATILKQISDDLAEIPDLEAFLKNGNRDAGFHTWRLSTDANIPFCK